MQNWPFSFFSSNAEARAEDDESELVFQPIRSEDELSPREADYNTLFTPPPQPSYASQCWQSFTSFFSSETTPPSTYERVTDEPLTSEQASLLNSVEQLYQQYNYTRAATQNLSATDRTIAASTRIILERCADVLVSPTDGTLRILLAKKTEQETMKPNYTTNNGWSSYLGCTAEAKTLVDKVIEWAKKELQDPHTEGYRSILELR